MKIYIRIFYNNINYTFGLLNSTDYSHLELKDVFVIDAFKRHNHSYYYKAFFYNSKHIYYRFDFDSKSKLHIDMQNLLKEELSDV